MFVDVVIIGNNLILEPVVHSVIILTSNGKPKKREK